MSSSQAHSEPDTLPRGLLWVAAAWVMLLVLRNAWLCDDAFITLRSVDNFVHGRGITWNPGQRVQVFSHPLWFGVLSLMELLFGHEYYSTLAVSLVLAAGVLALLVLAASPGSGMGALWLLALSCSKSFIDFSTSGLENVLTHALLIGWLHALWKSEGGSGSELAAGRLDVFSGLLLLTRLDCAVLIAPGYVWVCVRRTRTLGWGALLRGLAWSAGPALAWMAFSIVYFGLLLPNTAYAKLNVSLPLSERLPQTLFYFLSLVTDDPVTAVVLLLGVGVGLSAPSIAGRAVCAGVLLHLVYLGSIGGDFMLGRFFSAPLVMMVVLLLRTSFQARLQLPGFALLGLCTLATAAPPWMTGRPVGDAADAAAPISRFRDVTDERRFYFRDTGLIHARRGDPMPRGGWVAEGRKLRGEHGAAVYAAGIRGYFAGHETRIIDRFGLCDAFLAKIPVVPPLYWKSGHYARELPDGYADTVRQDSNLLRDPTLRALYDDVMLASTGPLWSGQRFGAIVRLNTGAHDVPVANYR